MQHAGKIVFRNERVGRLKGWSRRKITCGLCEGAGMRTPMARGGEVYLCKGCNGRGYIVTWQDPADYKSDVVA